MSATLPASAAVDVSAFSRIFENTTNSYKLLFFQAILNLFVSAPRPGKPIRMTFNDLAVEMAAFAWYPYCFFHLSLGVQDKTSDILDALRFSVQESAIGNANTQSQLRSAILDQSQAIQLSRILRFVPYRLLQPFFQAELSGKPDHRKNAITVALSNERFDRQKPLYRIVESPDPFIEVHPDWADYIRRSYPIIKGWTAYRWIEYLQTRNPNIPAIPNKLSPPTSRASLASQTVYWRAIMETAPVKCIYSQATLDPNDFSLDHFVPWSFVCHNQLWNLVPVSPAANSAKSNHLPAEQYIACFVDLQCAGLQIARAVLKPDMWMKQAEPFVSDLRIPLASLSDDTSVRKAYLGIPHIGTNSLFLNTWNFKVSRESSSRLYVVCV